jgi:hypothetical protein
MMEMIKGSPPRRYLTVTTDVFLKGKKNHGKNHTGWDVPKIDLHMLTSY